jgi:hypothetical protein
MMCSAGVAPVRMLCAVCQLWYNMCLVRILAWLQPASPARASAYCTVAAVSLQPEPHSAVALEARPEGELEHTVAPVHGVGALLGALLLDEGELIPGAGQPSERTEIPRMEW